MRNVRNEPEAIQWMGIEQQDKTKEKLPQDWIYYRNIISDVLDAALLTDEKGIITYSSQPVKRILGYEPEEIIGKSAFDFLHPDDREHSMSAFFKEVEQSPKARFIYSRVKKKSGEWLWCMIRGHNLLSNPYVEAVLINFFDDTPRRNAEVALIESERRLRNQAIILTNVYDLIATTDLGLNITSWNKVAEEMSGITAQEAIGAFFPDIIEIEYSTDTALEVAEMVFSKGIWHGEISFVSRAGERKYFLKTISILRDENGVVAGLLGVGKDITERKKIET
jgi:PAS domain S-box-containing protein